MLYTFFCLYNQVEVCLLVGTTALTIFFLVALRR